MKEQILLLMELQENESKIKSIKINKRKLPEKMNALKEKIRYMKEKMDGERERFEGLEMVHLKEEQRLKQSIENLKKTKNRLLEVKTNKEYLALLKEIEIAERKNREAEDKIIGILEELDNIQKEMKRSEEDLNIYRRSYEKEEHKIEKEMRSLDSKLLACQKKIGDIRGKIDVACLKKYESVKGIRNGIAVVPVRNGVCGGCHMNIPPQMNNELQKFENLITCPSCNRIIYWGCISEK